ncbi:conjugal transfer protein TraK [Rapidithrix thailandica]|uniref:Conjugal transfer protein TraK n=1 Tax=Rapidithrix thailandica TaxID=413964 RepID=A0AAW9SGX1_9BACT
MKEPVHHVNRSFRLLKALTFTSLLGSFIVSGLMGYLLVRQDKEAKVYVISESGTFPALEQDPRKVSPHEARQHIKTFMQLMFAHDAGTFQPHMEAALHLIDDHNGRRIYQDFLRGEVPENYVRYRSYTTLTVDSIQVDLSNRPFRGQVFARQWVHVDEQQELLPIGARFSLEKVYRTAANPFGLMIRDFDFILYEPQNTEQP